MAVHASLWIEGCGSDYSLLDRRIQDVQGSGRQHHVTILEKWGYTTRS